jgi:hypothetical protein
MTTAIQNSPGNMASVTSTSSELNGNKKTDTIVITTTDDHENTMIIKQHHNDEGEYE